uniref:Histidine biosynthesis bifunctional protein HisIE n=1 Tax=Paulinella micropora TaxID=1928728 RepID=A0A385HZA1_9EUKA|nr:histidine biosynthesis bifunctional protein HisIE [Paulinella micropora]AXY62978.1 histidine biosynthesis bifunctional protein HisIE [Paulinella micropora]
MQFYSSFNPLKEANLDFKEINNYTQKIINLENLQFNEHGLIFAIAQDWLDGAVLMAAWMSKEAIEITLLTGQVHYWSRSREKIWHKGATSGHFQKLKSMRSDCDADVLLLTIEQTQDISCHTGARSCFFNDTYEATDRNPSFPPADVCTELAQTITTRKKSPDAKSYTNKLLDGGDNRILKKIGEESAEFVMACKDRKVDEIVGEAADIIFHLQVALAYHDISWRDVLEVLATRRNAPRRH